MSETKIVQTSLRGEGEFQVVTTKQKLLELLVESFDNKQSCLLGGVLTIIDACFEGDRKKYIKDMIRKEFAVGQDSFAHEEIRGLVRASDIKD